MEGNFVVGVGVGVVAGNAAGVAAGTEAVKSSCCVVFAGIGGACVTSGDLKLIVGTSSGAEKGVNGVKGEKAVMVDGPSEDRGAVEGAVEPDLGDESGSIRADFGGTSGGSSDTTLCSLNLLSVRFGNMSVCDGMMRGVNCLPGL